MAILVFIDGSTIFDIIDELTYNFNRYGTDYDEIAIFDPYDDETQTIYFKVLNIRGLYMLVREWYRG